jgi:hypothetical protein
MKVKYLNNEERITRESNGYTKFSPGLVVRKLLSTIFVFVPEKLPIRTLDPTNEVL